MQFGGTISFRSTCADVEDLRAEHGVIASREAMRLWVTRTRCHFAGGLRQNRSAPNEKWHLDEVLAATRGGKFRLGRTVNADGEVLGDSGQAAPQRKGGNDVFPTAGR